MPPSIVLRGSPASLNGKLREARTLFMSPLSLTAQALGSTQAAAAAAEPCTLQEAYASCWAVSCRPGELACTLHPSLASCSRRLSC